MKIAMICGGCYKPIPNGEFEVDQFCTLEEWKAAGRKAADSKPVVEHVQRCKGEEAVCEIPVHLTLGTRRVHP
jgi:hypothetical protein